MKIKIMVLTCLVAVIVLSMGYEAARMPFIAFGSGEYNQTGSESKTKAVAAGAKIGVVSIRKIFQECKRNVKYRQETTIERDIIIAELKKLEAEIDAGQACLKPLKEGSSDYMAQWKEVLEKRAKKEVQERFYEQQMALKDQKWTEKLYEDILRETGEVARQKGLDLVLEKDEAELPAPSANELMLTIRTHKLLYSEGCLDISDEVMARLDKAK